MGKKSWSSQRDRNQSSGGGGRRDYRDNYNSGRMNYSRNDRYSPADRNVGGDMSPPIKRIRSTGVTRDWDERYSNYDSGYGHGVSVGHHNIGITHYRDNYGQHDRERDDEYVIT